MCEGYMQLWPKYEIWSKAYNSKAKNNESCVPCFVPSVLFK